MRLAVLLIALPVAGVGVGAWHFLDDRGAPSAAAPKTELDKEIETDRFFKQLAEQATAAEVTRLWQTNEVAAREKWVGKPIRIDGHVDRISVENFKGTEHPVLYFTEGGACTFNMFKPSPDLANLRHGERVIVLGQPRGLWPGVAHMTSHCRLIEYYEN